MSEELLNQFARSLQEQREKKGFTLQQVASKTKIDIKFLKAIESGEFDIMPEVYIRAFIKDYADFVELDSVETLRKFEIAKEGKSVEIPLANSDADTESQKSAKDTKTLKFISPEVGEKEVENNNTSKSTNLIFLIVAAALVIAVGIYFLFFTSSKIEIVKEKPFNQVLKENQRFKAEPPKSVKDITDSVKNSINNEEPFSLTLLSKDTVWIRLRIDNKIDKEFTLKPDEKQIISATDNIKLLVGNLGGIKFILNNKDYDFKGIKGEVQNFLVSRDNIQKILVKDINIDE